MRALPSAVVAVVTAVGVAACGGSGHAGSASLQSALSYFPQTSPVVATVDTKLYGPSARALTSAASGGTSATLVKAAVFSELAKLGIDYDRDLKPLFGQPIVVGDGGVTVRGTATPLLVAWQTESATALTHLLHDLHGVTRAGTHDGATMYALGSIALATRGPLLLVSNSAATITTALDRHRAGVGFSAAEYAQDTRGLPSGLISVVGDLQTALDTPTATQARKIPWVAAIKGYGVSLSSTSHHVALRFRLDTSGRPLSAADLPIASGSQAPGLAGSLPIDAALRDPGQVFAFILGATRSTGTGAFATLVRQEHAFQARTGVNIESFLRSLTGTLQLTSDGHTTIACLPTSAANAATFAKLIAHPAGHDSSRPLGNGFYAIREPSGTTFTAGVVGDEIVIGRRATVAQEQAYAHTASSASSSAGGGALDARVALGTLIRENLHAGANPLLGKLLSSIGDLTASAQASPQALTGTISVQVSRPAG